MANTQKHFRTSQTKKLDNRKQNKSQVDARENLLRNSIKFNCQTSDANAKIISQKQYEKEQIEMLQKINRNQNKSKTIAAVPKTGGFINERYN